MKLSNISLLLFLLSVVFWGGLTLFESALVGMSIAVERLLTFLLLVLPPGIGAILAVLSLKRREGRTWIAIVLLLVNAIFAFFQLMIVMFAG